MWYEIWDAETCNIVAWYDAKHDALQFVAQYIADNGQNPVTTWFLVSEDGKEDSDGALIASGDALVTLALQEQTKTIAAAT